MLDPDLTAIFEQPGYPSADTPVGRELRRLRGLPAYTSGTSDLVGFDFVYTHPHSFAELYEHIYLNGGYRFRPTSSAPVIIDCGGNIGVSVTWFKQQFPDARITTFEPDPGLAAVLRRNVETGGFSDVTVLEQAVWIHDGPVRFLSEGSDAGRISEGREQYGGREWEPTQVAGIRLKDWLGGPLDLLKLDIEGAEIDVLADCADSLSNVANVIFEYHSTAGAPQRLGATLAILEDAGFRLWVRQGFFPRDPLLSNKTNTGFDLQLEVFAGRIQ